MENAKEKEKVENQIDTPSNSSKSDEDADYHDNNKGHMSPKDKEDEFDSEIKSGKEGKDVIGEKKKEDNEEIIEEKKKEGIEDSNIKEQEKNSKHNKEQSNIPQLNFNHLSKFLLNLNLIKTPLNDTHKICLEFPSIDLDIKATDNADPKLIKNTFTIQSHPLLTNISINIATFYDKFKFLNQKELYALEDFKILLQIFTSILSSFNAVLFQYDLTKDLFPSPSPILTYKDTSIKQVYSDRMLKLHEELANEKDLSYKNLLFLMTIFTLFGDVSYRTFSVENYLRNLDSYLNVIFADFKLGLLLHFHMLILLQITIKKNSIDSFLLNTNHEVKKEEAQESKQKEEDSRKIMPVNIINNKRKGSKGSKGQSPYNTSPTFYYLDNYSIQHTLQANFQLIIMSSMLKIQLFGYISRSYLNISFNFSVLSFESIHFLVSALQSIPTQLTFNQEMIFTTQQVIYIISHFITNEFHIYLNHSFGSSIISCILSTYFPLIIQSKAFLADVNNSNESLLLPYTFYTAELEMILGVLRFNYRLKGAKNKSKTMSKNYSFIFNFTSFSIMTKKDKSVKDKHIRDMIITLNQRGFDEEDMVKCLAEDDGMMKLHEDIRKIFSELQHFKKYTIGVTLNQYACVNEQLRYYFGVIALEMQYYLHDHTHSHKNVVLAETDYLRFSNTLIVNNAIASKVKERQEHYVRYYKKLDESVVKFSHSQISALVELFEEVVIYVDKGKKKQFNPKVLLRGFRCNCVVISKEEKVIDLIVHVYNGEGDTKEKVMKIIEWIGDMKKNNDNVRNVKVVMRMKGFNENNYQLSEEYMKMLFPNVTMLYLIDEDYDLVFKEKKVFIHYHSKTGDNDLYKNFIDVMRKCYEILLFIIDKKFYTYNNLVFISGPEYILLQFKNGSLNIKQINPKVSLPSSLLFNHNPLDSTQSYPIAIIQSSQDISAQFSLSNLLRILKDDFLMISKENLNKEAIMTVVNKILEGKQESLRIVLFKEDIVPLVPLTGLGSVALIRMRFEGKNEEETYAKELIGLGKKVNVFDIEKSKNNYYSEYDIGTLFTLKRVDKTIEYFITNKSDIKTIKGTIDVYSLSYDALSTAIQSTKQKNEESQKPEESKGEENKPSKNKKQSEKDKNCLIF